MMKVFFFLISIVVDKCLGYRVQKKKKNGGKDIMKGRSADLALEIRFFFFFLNFLTGLFLGCWVALDKKIIANARWKNYKV